MSVRDEVSGTLAIGSLSNRLKTATAGLPRLGSRELSITTCIKLRLTRGVTFSKCRGVPIRVCCVYSTLYVLAVEDLLQPLNLGLQLLVDLIDVFDLSYMSFKVTDEVFTLSGQLIASLLQALHLLLSASVLLLKLLELL